MLTCGLSLQGCCVQKGIPAGRRWAVAASSEMTSSTPLMGACTALQASAVTSWLGTARNTPSRLSVSRGTEGQTSGQGQLNSTLVGGLQGQGEVSYSPDCA